MQRFKKENLRLFLKFSRFLLPYWKQELAVIILGEAAVVFALVNPYLSKLLIDKGLLNKDLNLFIVIGLGMGALFILNGLISAFVQYVSQYVESKVDIDIRKSVFEHLNKLSFDFFQSRSSGENIYKISYDIDRITAFITSAISEITTILPRTLFTFAIIFYLDRQMAVLALCLAPFLYFFPYYFSKKMRILYNELFKSIQGIFERLAEVFSHIQLVKAFGKWDSEFKNYIERLLVNIRLSLKTAKLAALSGFSSSVMSRLIAGLIFFYGGYLVIKGRLSFGSVTAIMLYITQLFGLQTRFAMFFQNAVMGMISCSRIEEILGQEPKIRENSLAKELRFDKGELAFRSVTFAYSGKAPILENINFTIDAGSHIGLMGPSGCGKTSIVNLVLRLFQPQLGEILIDGYNLKDIKFQSLYEQVGVVLQEPFLWNDTVENNIRYGKEDASLNEVLDVARLTGIDGFIEGLPQKYQTKIGENATLLSEGQKQRIAIARALIKNPAILILDEALSSLDLESEISILERLMSQRTNKTTIIISHRLNILNYIDWIYLLESPAKIIKMSPKDFLGTIKYSDLEFIDYPKL